MPVRLENIDPPKSIRLENIDTPKKEVRLTNIDVPSADTSFAEMNPLMKALDLISRPGYAVKSTISQLQEKPQSQANEYLDAAVRGFTGAERISANDLFARAGISGVPMLGFAGELATDPLMAFGGAGYKAIPKTLGFLAKTANKIPGVDTAVQSMVRTIEPVTATVKKLFVDKSGIPELTELIDKHLSNRQYLKGKYFKFGIETRNQIQDVAYKTGVSTKDIEKQIIDAIEQPQNQSSIPQINNIANVIKGSLSEMITKEMKAGVPITALSGGNRAMEYFPRIAKDDVVKYLKQAKIGNAKVWNANLSNAIQRKTGDYTLAEFNDLMRTQGHPGLGGQMFEDFFLSKPATVVTMRGMRSAKAITSAEFMNDVGKTFGQTANAPAYFEELSGSMSKIFPNLRGVKFDPAIIKEIERVSIKYINPSEPVNFLKVFDTVQNTWKRWTLAPFPKYHIRNMVGNAWNNHLAGVNPLAYEKAQAIQLYATTKNRVGSFGGGLPHQAAIKQLGMHGITPAMADDIIAKGEQSGVLGLGWYGSDIEPAIEKAFNAEIRGKEVLRNPLKTPQYLMGKAMNFGKAVENNARLAHYVDRLEKGYAPLDAALSVKKHLFDYSDLTDFERQIMKRVFPFYTWTRKNIPLQLQALWEQPQKFAPINYKLRERNTDDLLHLKYARPDLYERLPIELSRNVDSVTYVPLEGIIPAADLSRMFRPQEVVLELLSPYLRGPLELAFNKSATMESEVVKYDNETKELLKMDVPARLRYALVTFLPQARILNEVNKLVKKKKVGEELTGGEQAFQQTLSVVYKTTLEDLRKRALQTLNRKINDLESGMYTAHREERQPEIDRIKNTIKEVKKMMKDIR